MCQHRGNLPAAHPTAEDPHPVRHPDHEPEGRDHGEALHLRLRQPDADAAKAVAALDDEVDHLFLTIKGELVELIVSNREVADHAIDLIIIAKYLERIADHAVNIAQWAIFCVTGELVG